VDSVIIYPYSQGKKMTRIKITKPTWCYIVTFSNGEKWCIPVEVIAHSHAMYFFDSTDEYKTFEDSLVASLNLFENDNYEIEDWARNNEYWANPEEIEVFYINIKNE
jgi:hypothetical protein